MEKNTLVILCIGLVAIAIVITPVMAAPPNAGGPIDQILGIVQDIQAKVNTLVTNLGAVQTDVTQIKTTTDTINDKLNAPPEPTYFLYYTGPIIPPNREGETYSFLAYVVNMGDTPASLSWAIYVKDGDSDTMILESGSSATLEPQQYKWCNPTVGSSRPISYKFLTNSKYLTPTVIGYANAIDGGGYSMIYQYSPGDFQKIEIYD